MSCLQLRTNIGLEITRLLDRIFTTMTPQQFLLNRLTDFTSHNATRNEEARRITALVNSSPRAAYRDNFVPGHLTGSAWIVDPTTSKVLLLHHAKLNRWLQPGGHADGEYDLAAVALREAQEESGLTSLTLKDGAIFDLDIHTIPERGHEPAHLHFDVRFVVIADSSEPPIVSHESHDVAWFDFTEISQITSDESVLRMARKWLDQHL